MASTNTNKLEELKHKAKRDFEKANPKIWGQLSGDSEKVSKARSIEDRANKIRHKFIDHSKKHRSQWVSKETLKVFEEYNKQNLDHPKPGWVLNYPPSGSFTAEARKRVQGRIETRMKNIGEIEQRMKSRLVEQNTPVKSHTRNQNRTPDLGRDFSQSM